MVRAKRQRKTIVFEIVAVLSRATHNNIIISYTMQLDMEKNIIFIVGRVFRRDTTRVAKIKPSDTTRVRYVFLSRDAAIRFQPT